MTQEPLEARLLNERGKLLSFVRSKIADPELAEDVLQESLLKALRAAPDLQDTEKLLPWFYRILNNAITDTYRRKGVECRLHFSDPPQHQRSPVTDATVTGSTSTACPQPTSTSTHHPIERAL